MDAVERLVAVDEIEQMRMRLFRAIDFGDFETIAALLTDDVVVTSIDETGNGRPDNVVNGTDAFADFVRMIVGAAKVVHFATMPQIEVDDADHARGMWLVAGLLTGENRVFGYETMEDEYVRTETGWRVSRMTARAQAHL
ncbi:nuclear transport factor 2 family protein [Microbacterium sp. No. 7]|uniref:nuclear transport factor 2 family protein n=1 Tax=Microbacterium sp. No. 7 TaxID=1714373 RepID=UPI0006D29823|nr:nuclear transport factor 2 family protein [Microbacterium sp. No. 7]